MSSPAPKEARMTEQQKKKLIEVALPLPEVNDASAYDKMPGIGPHPKGIHHWWARLPLPTARAILFASVVDDPSEHPDKWPTEDAQDEERERLFDIVRALMGKRLHKSPEVYREAHEEMVRHCAGQLPVVLDPFAGGGSIPLEALRLGLPARASDLNPIAVLINKTLLETAPTYADLPPINPDAQQPQLLEAAWSGTYGLAEDVRYYAAWVFDRAASQLKDLYPKGPDGLEAVAWLWCRTVACPNPACRGAHTPLLRSLKISSKRGDGLWVEPVVDREACTWEFRTTKTKPTLSSTIGRRGGKCIICTNPIPLDHIRSEGKAGRLRQRLMAAVGEGRQYFGPDDWPESREPQQPQSVVAEQMPHNPFSVRPPLYGLLRFCDVFTPRQLHALNVFSSLVSDARDQVVLDVQKAGDPRESTSYADAVATLLAFAVDRCVDFNNSLCRWSSSNQKVMSTFGRQAIPMIWDFAEANLVGSSVGSWQACSDYIAACVEAILPEKVPAGSVRHGDAAAYAGEEQLLVSTDPPYYNNIDYSDLSDFFYVWLRRSLAAAHPEVFGTLLTPKASELVASPYRFDGDKVAARDHFESGFRQAFTALRGTMDSRFPLTVYYAFKQADEASGGDEEAGEGAVDQTTGWETLLDALVGSGFQITGTWPVRASQRWRQMSMGMNALASYIVLACRSRPESAPQTDRRSFLAELKRELPAALRHLQQGNIAPVDFAQAAIGPGMAIYSRYGRILESSGRPMTVRTALSLINQTLTEVLSEQEDNFDADSRWALAWFDQHGFEGGEFGDAELLSKAKVTSVAGLQQAGVINSKGGQVALLRPADLPHDWDPTTDKRLTVWEMTHHLLRVYYYDKQGDEAGAALLRRLGSQGEVARDLAYRLFNICEKRRWSQEAQAYNALVLGWPELARLARAVPQVQGQQGGLFGQGEE